MITKLKGKWQGSKRRRSWDFVQGKNEKMQNIKISK